MDKRLKLLVTFFFLFFLLNFFNGLEKEKRVLQAAFTIILWWPSQPQRLS